MGSKKNIKIVFIFGFLSLFFGCLSKKEAYYQDVNSNSIKIKKGFFEKEKIVLQTDSFKQEKANWKEGVTLAMPKPLLLSQTMAVKSLATEEIFLVQVVSIKRSSDKLNDDKVVYIWKKFPDGDLHQDQGEKINLSNFSVDCSYESEKSLFVYTDLFFLNRCFYAIGLPYLNKDIKLVVESDVNSIKYATRPFD